MLNVYVTNLGRYNEGELIGRWITLPADEEDVKEALDEIGISEEYEEYFFTDWEWEDDSINGFPIGEYSGLRNTSDMLEEFDAIVGNDIDLFNCIVESAGNYEDALNIYDQERFISISGVKTEYDLGHALVFEFNVLGDVDEGLESFIDYEAVVRTHGLEYTICRDSEIAVQVY